MNSMTQQTLTMVDAVKAYEAICRGADPNDENWYAPVNMVLDAPIRTAEDLAAFIEYLKASALGDVNTSRADIRTFDDIDGHGFDWEGVAVFKLAREAANFLPVKAEDLGIRLREVAERDRAEALRERETYRAQMKREEDARWAILDTLSPIERQALTVAAAWERCRISRKFSAHVEAHAFLTVGKEYRLDDIGDEAFAAMAYERADAIRAALPVLQERGLVTAYGDGFTVTAQGSAILDLARNLPN